MAENTGGDKTEQPTARRLEEAIKHGQIARSPEVQTVFVLGAAFLAMQFCGAEIWRSMAMAMASILGHLHDTPLTLSGMQTYAINGSLWLGHCVWPVLAATVIGGLLAGGIQTRFRASSEALALNWGKLNPMEGIRRLFSIRSTVSTGIGMAKLFLMVAMCYGVIKGILADPIFHSTVDVARIATFMAESSFKLFMQVGMCLVILAAVDYTYKIWQTNQDLKMSKQEIADETKNQEGDPKVKGQMRRRRQSLAKRKMLAEIPKADVVITNPTHLAIALRYDKKTMKAPKIVAKGSRLNALRIREIAQQHQVPIIENKPLARVLFKYGKVGGEVPAQLYAVVAEILAWVYRVNAYRYYRERCQA
jgi:flagellar biosynthetic protein FlhB